MTSEQAADGLIGRLDALARRYRRVGWAVADQVLVSGASFATTLLVARFLGKQEFGRFVLAWLAALIIQNVQIALIMTPATTFAMREAPARQPAYFGAICIHQAVFAVLTTALAFALATLSARVVLVSFGSDGRASAPQACAPGCVRIAC